MTELVAGDVLEGRYVIDRPIARGGMSTVYRAVDTRLDRDVAAKVMDSRYVGDQVFLQRFSREARAMAQLSHPNLVGVYDFSANGEDVFLIMELITGGTLRELLAERGPMPPHAAATVMRAVLTGLSVAHDKGMVHRDIKPDNILIGGDHTVKLGDFGLVRAASESRRSSDHIVGTVAYLSPEQVDGSEITQASDVYSAGVVLFELLTGRAPFSGDTDMAHAFARLTRDVPAPSQCIEGVPKLFDELVATATARSPHDRFHDAGEFLDALDDVCDELNLPRYRIPVPTESAAHRVAAIPTSVTEIHPRRNDIDKSLFPTVQPDDSPATESFSGGYADDYPGGDGAQYGDDDAWDYYSSAQHSSAHPARPAPANPAPPRPETNRSGVGLFLALLVISLTTAMVAVLSWQLGAGVTSELPQIIR
ncbi:protein kinase domain-containing protein [Corynebacterium aquatimens]|uniref:non-specific serine/threonine protein kinase n=1 Tax=Corynebacterium aquatimens TaxID=1190508 RepID=A0A931GXM8_9CORY|nr:protein kinase [Corynebacterium aquatimens]MBG6121979.1 serine/threonine-protein kinase [Corynebacterium aquatimens]WJY65482.1 Serine/threonine-protein kinase PknL [Corynebacterium aquatimens]